MLRLTDDQWERIREHFPEESIPESRPGRKPIPARSVLEAVLWILNTGAQWHMLPQCYPNYKTVAMAGGTLFRMATVEAALGCSLGVLRQQFPRIRRARQHHDALKANLR